MVVDGKLILVSGSGQSRKLAQQLHDLLRDVYKLGNKVQLIISKDVSELTAEEKINKNHKRTLLIDRFNDGETRVECGLNLLKSFKNTHIVFVNYLLEPGLGFSANDKLAEIRAFGELLRHVKIKKLTIAFPYPIYVRAHSTEKYEKKGLYQSNTLQRLAKDIYYVKAEWPNKVAKVELITIDPHNPKLWTYCDSFGVEHRDMAPFQKDIDYTKLNFDPETVEGRQRLISLRPFYNYFLLNKEDYSNVVIIAADEGSESRAKKFSLVLDLGFEKVCVIDKQRVDAGKVEIKGIKPYSLIQKEHLAGKTCIITDDMVDSGGTANEVAKFLKESCGVRRVDLWVTHTVCTNPEKLSNTVIDKIVCIDTVPLQIPKVIQIKGSAHLLSACIYKSYMSEISKNQYL